MKISFAGCGLLGPYQFAVAHCIRENAPWLLEEAEEFYGSSVGSVVAAALACEVTFMNELNSMLVELAEKAYASPLGVLSSKFDVDAIVGRFLDRILPKDAHKKVRGRLRISVTEVPSLQNRIFADFNTRNELITAIRGSCFIPGFSSWSLCVPQYRGKRIIDGGFTNNLPFGENHDVITVAPFPGDFDICPAHLDPYPTATRHFLDIVNMNIQVNTWNWGHLFRTLLPSGVQDFSRMQYQGFTDTLSFLRKRGFVSEVVFRPVMASRECLLGGCEEITRLEVTDEGECPRDAPTTGEHLQSLPISSFYGRRCSLQTSDYYSVGMGTSPRPSFCLSEEGSEAAILEDVDAVMATEEEQSVGDIDSDAELDSQCESSLQSARAMIERRRHSWTTKDTMSPRLLSMASQCIYATLQGAASAPRTTNTTSSSRRRQNRRWSMT